MTVSVATTATYRVWARRGAIGCGLVLLAALILVGTLVAAFFSLTWGLGACLEQKPIVKLFSPDGHYVARSALNSCGGATGQFESHVSLRGLSFRQPEVVFSYPGTPEDLTMRWADRRTLVISHSCEVIWRQESAWEGVTIRYQKVAKSGSSCREDDLSRPTRVPS